MAMNILVRSLVYQARLINFLKPGGNFTYYQA
jgi:hypothetical protein